AEGDERGELHRPWGGESLADEADGSDPAFVLVGAPDAVAVVVGVVGGDLQGEGHDHRRDGPPPDDAAVDRVDGGRGADRDGDDRGGQRPGAGTGDPDVHVSSSTAPIVVGGATGARKPRGRSALTSCGDGSS